MEYAETIWILRQIQKAFKEAHMDSEAEALAGAINYIGNARGNENLPSAQPEIIRCKDCAKRECCRTSTIWAVAPGDNWYCADAERRTDE